MNGRNGDPRILYLDPSHSVKPSLSLSLSHTHTHTLTNQSVQNRRRGGGRLCGPVNGRNGDPRILSIQIPHIQSSSLSLSYTYTKHTHSLTRVYRIVGGGRFCGPVNGRNGDPRILSIQISHIQPTDSAGSWWCPANQFPHSHRAETQTTFSYFTFKYSFTNSWTNMIIMALKGVILDL